MMIECERHGFNEAVQVSPDLRERVNASEEIKGYVSVHYEYNDEIVDSYFLSTRYAEKYELRNGGILPLPDDYPKWVMGLVLVCKKCFEDCAQSS